MLLEMKKVSPWQKANYVYMMKRNTLLHIVQSICGASNAPEIEIANETETLMADLLLPQDISCNT